MSGRWYYDRPKWRPPAKPVEPQAFDWKMFDTEYERIRAEVNVSAGLELIPAMNSPSALRLAVLRGYFKAYADGRYNQNETLQLVQREMTKVTNDPTGRVTACYCAIAGFLAMGRPDIASDFINLSEMVTATLNGPDEFLQLPPGSE